MCVCDGAWLLLASNDPFCLHSATFFHFLSIQWLDSPPHPPTPRFLISPPSPPSRLSSVLFLHAAWVSQMEWLAAVAVMQNTVEMNAGLPQWERHKRRTHLFFLFFYTFAVWKKNVWQRQKSAFRISLLWGDKKKVEIFFFLFCGRVARMNEGMEM